MEAGDPKRMRFGPTGRFLDVATGTADLAIMAAEAFPGIRVEGIDFAQPMLAIGRAKVERRGLGDRVRLKGPTPSTCPFRTRASTSRPSPSACATSRTWTGPCARWPESRSRGAR